MDDVRVSIRRGQSVGRAAAGPDENTTRTERDEQQAARCRQKATGEKCQDALTAVRAQNTGHEHPRAGVHTEVVGQVAPDQFAAAQPDEEGLNVSRHGIAPTR
jgi:hypothetical protein